MEGAEAGDLPPFCALVKSFSYAFIACTGTVEVSTYLFSMDETWSVAQRKDVQQLKLSREVCAEETTLPKREEGIEGLRNLCNEDIHNFTLQQILQCDQIKTGKKDGPCSVPGNMKNTYVIIIIQSPEEKIRLWKHT